MATGIPTTASSKTSNKSLTINYEGKEGASTILSAAHSQFFDMLKIEGVNCHVNKLLYGDNFDALLYLLNNGYKGKIKLIYIDPPYASAANYVHRNQELAYSDTLSGSEYVEFLRKRLIILKELLSDDGSIYLHLDSKMAFTMKIILDEVFGVSNFRSFITRQKCSTKNYTKHTFGNIADYIMFYTKSSSYTWNRSLEPWDEARIKKQYPCIDEQGRRYKKVPIHAPGVRNGETGKPWRGMLPPEGKHWQYLPSKLDEFDSRGEIYWSATGNPRRKVFFNESSGVPVQDIWLGMRDSVNQSQRTTGYPTEKNYEMMKLIIDASSNPGDYVLDCFAGSGTTLGAAEELNRYWIGIDNSPISMKSIIMRFMQGLEVHGDYVASNEIQQQLFQFEDTLNTGFTIFSTAENNDFIRNELLINTKHHN